MNALQINHPDRLSSDGIDWLERLAAQPWSPDVYLAGSAALALYVGHRPIRGLDIMCPTNRLAGQDRRDLLAELLEIAAATGGTLKVETARDGYLYARTSSGLALRFFYYPYPLIEPELELAGFPIVSPIDFGLMKIAAIISRGTRRDFVDLFLLARHVPLATLLDRSPDKFGHVRDFPLQALKALADLSLVEGEPMPQLATPAADPLEWGEVESWLREETQRLGRQHVGLPSEPTVTEQPLETTP